MSPEEKHCAIRVPRDMTGASREQLCDYLKMELIREMGEYLLTIPRTDWPGQTLAAPVEYVDQNARIGYTLNEFLVGEMKVDIQKAQLRLENDRYLFTMKPDRHGVPFEEAVNIFFYNLAESGKSKIDFIKTSRRLLNRTPPPPGLPDRYRGLSMEELHYLRQGSYHSDQEDPRIGAIRDAARYGTGSARFEDSRRRLANAGGRQYGRSRRLDQFVEAYMSQRTGYTYFNNWMRVTDSPGCELAEFYEKCMNNCHVLGEFKLMQELREKKKELGKCKVEHVGFNKKGDING